MLTPSFVPLHLSRPYQVAIVSSTLALAVIGFFPLFAGPTYEAALAAGLAIPIFVAASTAFEVAWRRPRAIEALGRGLGAGLVCAAVALLLAWLHGLRVGLCNPWWGTAVFALAPASGALMAGAWGAAAGLVAEHVKKPRRRAVIAILLAIAGPIAGIVGSLVRFYTSPMVFAYDPFFGFFAGPLYDTIIDPLGPLLTYRAGSALTLAACAVLASHLTRSESGRLGFTWLRRPVLAVSGIAALVASITITLFGDRLGHYSTAHSIREHLGRVVSGKRCEIVYSRSLFERDARLVLGECEGHVRQVERFFGARGPDRITIFLFASTGEKGRLMGAATTYIAKPWRREVYVQNAGYPHPVLGHEVAHVLAGSFADGPFLVAGPLGGWLPDPGRIEGLAVAAAPSENADLALQQWSRAMLDLGILPKLDSVFRLSFLGENASKAYTVAGAFIEWFRGQYGATALRRWYGGEELEQVVGQDLEQLEAKWRASIVEVEVNEEALHSAKARFDRPGIFERSCPHVVDELAANASERLNVNDYREARRLFEELLELDSHHLAARMGLGICALRAGQPAEAARRFEQVSRAGDLHRLERASGVEALADMSLARGDVAAAAKGYAAVAGLVVDEDHLRALDVKSSPPSEIGRQAIVALLVGDPRFGSAWDVAAAKLGQWLASEPEQGLPGYLLGKNLYNRGRLDEAAAYLDHGLARRIDSPRVMQEALRTRLLVGCALGQRDRARSVYQTLQGDKTLAPARRAAITRFAERCGLL